MGLTVCTIVARNYLAQARVLAESFRSFHPDGQMVVLVFDDLHQEVDSDTEPFDVYRLEDLGMDVAEFHRMAMIYDVMEFATAVKPWLLETILDSGASHVLYLDPDIQVYASLEPLAELAVGQRNRVDPSHQCPLSRVRERRSMRARSCLRGSTTWDSSGSVRGRAPSSLFGGSDSCENVSTIRTRRDS